MIFKPGDIIEWCGETYRVRKNYGDHGEVEYLDGELASNNFYWTFEGEAAVLSEYAFKPL